MDWIGMGYHYEPNDVIGNNPGYVFATLLAILGIVLSVRYARRDKRIKTLDYEVVTSASLLSAPSKKLPDLKLSYAEQIVDEPKLLEVRIENSGKEAIIGEDYQRAISLRVSNAKILDVNIARTSSEDLEISDTEWSLNQDEELVIFKPALLNAGDYFVAQLIVDGYEGTAEVSSRFRDQNRTMIQTRFPVRSAPDSQESVVYTMAKWIYAPLAVIGFCFGPLWRNSNPDYFYDPISADWAVFLRLFVYGLFLAVPVMVLLVIVLLILELRKKLRNRKIPVNLM